MSGWPSAPAKDGVTSAPGTNCGSPGAVRLYRPGWNQPNTSKLVVCSWYACASCTESAVPLFSGSVVRAPNTLTKRSPPGYGTGRSSTPLTTVKIAVADPIPTANATTASNAMPGAVFQDAQA